MSLSSLYISIVLPLVYTFTFSAFLLLMRSSVPFISYLIGIFVLHLAHSSVISPVIFSDSASDGVIDMKLFLRLSWYVCALNSMVGVKYISWLFGHFIT